MRACLALLLFLAMNLGAATAVASSPVSSAEVGDVFKSMTAEFPFFSKFPTDALKPNAEGIYLAKDVQFRGAKATLMVYRLHDRIDAALLLDDLSIDPLFEGLGDGCLDVFQLKRPVVLFCKDIKAGTVETTTIADLPAPVRDAIQATLAPATSIYLRKGLNLTAKVAVDGVLRETFSILKDLSGFELSRLAIQTSFGKDAYYGSALTLYLRYPGSWDRPFGLNRTRITDATLFLKTNKKTKERTLAAWGEATIGSTTTTLFAQRSRFDKKWGGEAYGVDSPKVSLKLVLDLIQALPDNPLRPPGLGRLPLERVQILHPAYQAPKPGMVPDFSKFLVYAGLAAAPDGKLQALLVSGSPDAPPHATARVEIPLAPIALKDFYLKVTPGEVSANGKLDGGFKLGDLSLGGGGDFRLHNEQMRMHAGLQSDVFGLKAGKSMDLGFEDGRLKFSTDFSLPAVGGATLVAQTGSNFGLPWEVHVDATGLAGKIWDAGLDVYKDAKKELAKLGIPVVEPTDVAHALTHADALLKEQTWTDLGKEALHKGEDFVNPNSWAHAIQQLQVGQAFTNPGGTLSAASDFGLGLVGKSVGIARSVGTGAGKFFKSVGHGFKKAWKWLSGHGGHKKDPPPPPRSDPSKVYWGELSRANVAYRKPVTASSEDITISKVFVDITHGRKEFAVNGNPNPPLEPANDSWCSKEEVFPWIEVDLGRALPLEAIVLRVWPDEKGAPPGGLQGAVVAVSATVHGPALMDPANRNVSFFRIQQKGANLILLPSQDHPPYRAFRDRLQEIAKKFWDGSVAAAPNPWAAGSHWLDNALIYTDPNRATAEFKNARAIAETFMHNIRYIRVFLPRKGRLVVTELKAVSIEDLAMHDAYDPHSDAP